MQGEKPTVNSKTAVEQDALSLQKPIVLGYGLDILSSRFFPEGVHGFKKKPILSQLNTQYDEQTKLTLPNQASITALNQESQVYLCESTIFNASKKIIQDFNLKACYDTDNLQIDLQAGAFHEDLLAINKQAKTSGSEGIYMLSHHNFMRYKVELPDYTSKEWREMAQPDIVNLLDLYAKKPKQYQAQLFELFNQYGAFFCKSALYGGFFRQAAVLPYNNLMNPKLNQRVFDILHQEKMGKDLSYDEMQYLDCLDYKKYINFSVQGGYPNIMNQIGLGTIEEKKQVFDQWKQSIQQGHLSFVDFDVDSLVPLWQLANTYLDAQKIAQGFFDWYEEQLIHRQLLPRIITDLKVIERDSPLPVPDVIANENSLELINQNNNRYIYLIYIQEWAHHVLERKDKVVTGIKLGSHLDQLSLQSFVQVCNQYDRPANLTIEPKSSNVSIPIYLEKQELTLQTLTKGIHHIKLAIGLYADKCALNFYNTLPSNLYNFSKLATYQYAHLLYLPFNHDANEA